MDEQPNLREFLNEVSSFSEESSPPANAAAAAKLAAIGEVVEIAGSGSQIRIDGAALAALQSHKDPSVAMSGQVGSQVKMFVDKNWLIANVRTMMASCSATLLSPRSTRPSSVPTRSAGTSLLIGCFAPAAARKL